MAKPPPFLKQARQKAEELAEQHPEVQAKAQEIADLIGAYQDLPLDRTRILDSVEDNSGGYLRPEQAALVADGIMGVMRGES